MRNSGIKQGKKKKFKFYKDESSYSTRFKLIKFFHEVCFAIFSIFRFFSLAFFVWLFLLFFILIFCVFYSFSFFEIVNYILFFFFSFSLYVFVAVNFFFSFFLFSLKSLLDVLPFKTYGFFDSLPYPKVKNFWFLRKKLTPQERKALLSDYAEKYGGFTNNTRMKRRCLKKLQKFFYKMYTQSNRFPRVVKSIRLKRRILSEFKFDDDVAHMVFKYDKIPWWLRFPFLKFGMMPVGYNPKTSAYWWLKRWQKRKQESFWTALLWLYGGELLLFFEITLRFLLIFCGVTIVLHMIVDYYLRTELFFRAREIRKSTSPITVEYRLRVYRLFFKRYYRFFMLKRINKTKTFVRKVFKFFFTK